MASRFETHYFIMFVHPTSIYWPLLFLRCAQGSGWLRGRLWSCGVWDRVWIFHTSVGYFISAVCSSVTITMANARCQFTAGSYGGVLVKAQQRVL